MTLRDFYAAVGGDYEDACKRLINDGIIGKFIMKFPSEPSYGKLMEAAGSGDMTAVFEAAHALKGVTANLALESLSETAGEITEATRGGSLREGFDLDGKLAELTKRYQATIDAIGKLD